jgi:hypothetical protein
LFRGDAADGLAVPDPDAMSSIVEHILYIGGAELACGRHFRKDLPAADAARERDGHVKRFSPSAVMKLSEPAAPANGGYTSASSDDRDRLASDPVGVFALEYGSLESKLASLAQLRFLPGVRPELALMSIGRAYVNRCVENDGRWTSELHLLWWTRRRRPCFD